MITPLLILITIIVIVFLIRKWMDKPYYIINCYLCKNKMHLNFDPQQSVIVCVECQPELKQKLDIKAHKDYAPKKRV